MPHFKDECKYAKYMVLYWLWYISQIYLHWFKNKWTNKQSSEKLFTQIYNVLGS